MFQAKVCFPGARNSAEFQLLESSFSQHGLSHSSEIGKYWNIPRNIVKIKKI